MNFASVNAAAVVVASLYAFFLGLIWFSFSWKKRGSTPNFSFLAILFLSSFVISYIFAQLLAWTGLHTFFQGACLGFLSWIGFVLAPGIVTVYSDPSRLGSTIGYAGYAAAKYVVVSGILGAFC